MAELVTNAVVHAGTPLRLADGGVLVEVFDGSSAPPIVEHLEPGSDRGMRLVVELAAKADWRLTGTGRCVRAYVAVAAPD